MEIVLLIAALSVVVFTVVFAALYLLWGRRRALEERVRQQSEDKQSKFSWADYRKKVERVIKPLGDIIPRSPEEMSRQERRLVAAGIRHKDAAVMLYGAKLALLVALLVFFTLIGWMASKTFLSIAFSLLLAALIPDVWLSRRKRNRQERIQLAIPDVLDLTIVSVEAGLGLDQALMRVGQEVGPIHPELSDELRLYNLEVNAGRGRADALRNLADRTLVDDLKSLCAVLIQTDRFGTGVAQSLRVFSESLRTKRRQRAEERAAKTAIKMVPVLVFFIFPLIFIVVVLPAFIAIVNELLPRFSGR